MAAVNDVINGYRLRANLHTSLYTQVFEVVEPTSNRHFAMKILLPEYAKDSRQRSLLFHEASVGIKMKHPNVVNIIKVSRSPKTPHFIMEVFSAGSLANRLMSRDPKDKAYLIDNAKRLFQQVATGLAYMNTSGWVHRDIKPANILANAQGEAKIIDFAIASKIPTGFFEKLCYSKPKAGGTHSYMSPEQIRNQMLDGRADIYSYGATLYELTTGRPPFRAASFAELDRRHLNEQPQPPTAHNAEITDQFSALVMKMLAKKPEDRFQTFHELMMAMREVEVYKRR